MIYFEHSSGADSDVTIYPGIKSIHKFYLGSKEFIQDYHEAQNSISKELQKYVPKSILRILELPEELRHCSDIATQSPRVVSEPECITGIEVTLDQVEGILTDHRVPKALANLILSSLMGINVKKMKDGQIVITDIAFSIPVFLYIEYKFYLWRSGKNLITLLNKLLSRLNKLLSR